MQESQALQKLLTSYHEGCLAHAFLLETNDQEKCIENLLQFLKVINCPQEFHEDCTECNLCHLIETRNLPSLVIVSPETTIIKKEQILELKHLFQTKPTFSKYNVYIIENAECLNASSANTMLKFIEEPEDFILGFFITNNKENIIDTVRSRCQILLDYYSGEENHSIPKIWQSIAVNYIKEVSVAFDAALLYNKDVLNPLIHDRKELLYLFQSIFDIYYSLYICKINNSSLNSSLEDLRFLLKKDQKYFLHKMNFVNEILDELNYNLNTLLILDRFVLEGSDLS